MLDLATVQRPPSLLRSRVSPFPAVVSDPPQIRRAFACHACAKAFEWPGWGKGSGRAPLRALGRFRGDTGQVFSRSPFGCVMGAGGGFGAGRWVAARLGAFCAHADALSLGLRFSGVGDAGAPLNRFLQRFSGTDKPLKPEFHTLAASEGARCQPS